MNINYIREVELERYKKESKTYFPKDRVEATKDRMLIFYGGSKPIVAEGKEEVQALKFIYEYNHLCVHYYWDNAPIDFISAILRLEKKGCVKVCRFRKCYQFQYPEKVSEE